MNTKEEKAMTMEATPNNETEKKTNGVEVAPLRITRELEVQLTDKERLDRMSELLKAMQHVDELVAQKTLQTSEVNADIKTAKRDVRVIQAALNSGKEKRDVECIERHVFQTNTIEVVRTDTGQIIEKRAMSSSERQGQLPLDAKPGEPLTATVAEHVEAKAEDSAETDEDPGITDPESVLGAMGEESKAKRGRKAKSEN